MSIRRQGTLKDLKGARNFKKRAKQRTEMMLRILVKCRCGIKTDSAQSSSNKCKNYLLKI